MPRATSLDKLAIGAGRSTSVARNLMFSPSDVSPPEGPVTGGDVQAHLYDIYNTHTRLSAHLMRPRPSGLPYPKLHGLDSQCPCIK